MPRTARASAGNVCYHVLNRGNGRQTLFHHAEDYAAFLGLMADAEDRDKCPDMRLLGYCLMPNHVHFVLWPPNDGDLGRWMQWLMTAHVRRHHKFYNTDGRIWQGRFKAFPIEADEHLLAVLRYVERNPVRSKLLSVDDASLWPWSSCSLLLDGVRRPSLAPLPFPRPDNWLERVNTPLTAAELLAVQQSVDRGRPFGSETWVLETARQLGLESTIRSKGRPKSH
jgi:putative transposase